MDIPTFKDVCVIGIGGENGVGKSTLAEEIRSFLCTQTELHPLVGSFADGVRRAIDAIYCCPEIYSKEAEKGQYNGRLRGTIRETLIGVGQGLKPHLGNDIWIWSLYLRNKDKIVSAGTNVLIIDDLRFKEEREWIEAHESNHLIYVLPNDQAEKPEYGVPFENSGSIYELRKFAREVSEEWFSCC